MAIRDSILDNIAVHNLLLEQEKTIADIAFIIAARIADGGKIMLCGNGGSAADAQHFAAEFVGRFKRKRGAWPALALTTDTSVLTCVANDYSFEDVFARQVDGLACKGDVLVVISTSGNSENIIRALEAAEKITTVGLLGKDGGEAAALCNYAIIVPSGNTARIQEAHATIMHLLCEEVERIFFEEGTK